MVTRGIVITASWDDKAMPIIPDADELRRLVLYWDTLAWVDELNVPLVDGKLIKLAFGHNHSPDWLLLWQEGVMLWGAPDFAKKESFWADLAEWGMNSPKLDDGDSMRHFVDQVSLFGGIQFWDFLNENSTGIWSLGQTGHAFRWPIAFGAGSPSIEIHLTNCLPSPGASVPIEDILEFRLKRRAELLRFRSAIDKLASDIEKAEDKIRSFKVAAEEIDRSLLGLHRLLDESKFDKIISTVRTTVDLKDSRALNILFPVLGAAGAGLLDVPKELGALAGLGLNAFLSICTKKNPKIESVPKELRDYAYVYEADVKWGKK